MPTYCRQFDVGLIPFKINELTQAVNPIKLREYLATVMAEDIWPRKVASIYSSLACSSSSWDERHRAVAMSSGTTER